MMNHVHIYIYIHKCHLIERAKVVSVSASLTMEATSSRVFWAEVTPHDFVPKICGSLGVMLRTSNSYGLYKFVYLYRKWIHWHTLHYIKLYTSKARYVFPQVKWGPSDLFQSQGPNRTTISLSTVFPDLGLFGSAVQGFSVDVQPYVITYVITIVTGLYHINHIPTYGGLNHLNPMVKHGKSRVIPIFFNKASPHTEVRHRWLYGAGNHSQPALRPEGAPAFRWCPWRSPAGWFRMENPKIFWMIKNG